MPERTPAASNVDLSHSGTRGRCVTATYHESISRRTNAAEKPRSYAKARRIRRRDDNADRVISVQHHSYSRLSTAKYNVILSLPAGNYSPKGLGPGVRAWKQQKGNESASRNHRGVGDSPRFGVVQSVFCGSQP